jgi:hypothetical protein
MRLAAFQKKMTVPVNYFSGMLFLVIFLKSTT